MISSSGLLEQLTELRRTLMRTSLSEDMNKDTGEEPDEKIHRARSGRVPSPCGVGVHRPPYVDVFANLQALITL